MQTPVTIGRYRIESLLGRGAMGVVYKAHDPDIDRPVAIKLIRANLLDGESREQYLLRFRDEAKIAGRCMHANIVGVYDFSTHEGSPFLVLEYVEGADLSRAFPRGTQTSVGEVVHVALGVLDALAYAHGFGIVHRDIKPGNILLTPSHDLKVADFGISRLNAPDTTQSAVLVGTPSYMSPEQCRGDPVDGRCDLFSLGCVMHELLTGAHVFKGGSYAETIYKLTHEPHRPLTELRTDLPPGLVAIVDRVLAKRPEERFDSAMQMASAIRALPESAASSSEQLATVMLPALRSRGAPSAELGEIADTSLVTIERLLAHHIGPMAGYHLRRALQEAHSIDEFCRLLAAALPEPSHRAAFVDDARDIVSANRRVQAAVTRNAPPAAASDDGALVRLQQALAEIMGPIAPKLLARARSQTADPKQIEDLCCAMIPQTDERERFRHLLRT